MSIEAFLLPMNCEGAFNSRFRNLLNFDNVSTNHAHDDPSAPIEIKTVVKI